jgi:tetratricopeptide (TPR) repeat protein
VLHLQDERGEAFERLHQALEFYERTGAKRGVALACNNLGDVCWRDGAGDWETARAYWQRSRSLYEEIGDARGLAIALRNLGEAQARLGLPEAAEPLLRRARSLANALEDDEIRDGVDRALARVWAARQNY